MQWSLKKCRHLMTGLHLPLHRKQRNHSLANSSWRFNLFPLQLSVIHSLHHLWLPSSTWLASHPSVARQAWDLMDKARHLSPKRQTLQGFQHRCCRQVSPGPTRTSSLAPSCSRVPMGHVEERPTLALQDGQLCDSQAEKVSVQHVWHTMPTSPHLINHSFRNYHY